MDGFDISKFVTTLIGLMVGVVILGAIATVISGISLKNTDGEYIINNGQAIETMLGIIPLVAVAGLILGGVFYFIKARN